MTVFAFLRGGIVLARRIAVNIAKLPELCLRESFDPTPSKTRGVAIIDALALLLMSEILFVG
jgi:hypothetical protein